MFASYIPLKNPQPTKATTTKRSDVVAPVRTTKGRPRRSARHHSSHEHRSDAVETPEVRSEDGRFESG